MPKSVLNCSLTATQGKYAFDPVSRVLTWDVGKVDPQKLPNIRGTVRRVGPETYPRYFAHLWFPPRST